MGRNTQARIDELENAIRYEEDHLLGLQGDLEDLESQVSASEDEIADMEAELEELRAQQDAEVYEEDVEDILDS